MNPEEILELCATMRVAQKTYFRTKTHEALRVSKDYERRVDDALRLWRVRDQQEQPGLDFDVGGEA